MAWVPFDEKSSMCNSVGLFAGICIVMTKLQIVPIGAAALLQTPFELKLMVILTGTWQKQFWTAINP